MRLDKLTPKESGAGLALATRSRNLIYAAMAAAALSGTACNGEDPNGNGTGGRAAEGGTGGGGTGGGGAAGANPCEDLKFEGLAKEVLAPGEENAIVNVDLGAGHLNEAYNGLRLEVKSDILTQSSLIGLEAKTDVTADTGYELVEMKGFRTLAIDPDQNYILNEDGICVLNTVELDEAMMANIDNQPIATTPPDHFLSALRVQEGGEGVLENFELTAQGTRANISELNGEGHFFANTKPVVTSSVTRDQNGHFILDLAGTTDEGEGSDLVLDNLGITASDGLVFAPVSGQPGVFRSANPSDLSSFDLSVAGLSEGVVDDTTDTAVNVPEKPVITNLAIDCSGGPVPGSCAAGGFPYPVDFNVTDVIGCTATPEVTSGAGTAGSTSSVILDSGSGSFDYTTGSNSGNFIKITVDCNGAGGVDSEFTEFEIQ